MGISRADFQYILGCKELMEGIFRLIHSIGQTMPVHIRPRFCSVRPGNPRLQTDRYLPPEFLGRLNPDFWGETPVFACRTEELCAPMDAVVVQEVFEALEAVGAKKLPHAVIGLLKELPGAADDTVVLYSEPLIDANDELHLFCVKDQAVTTIDGGQDDLVFYPEDTWWIFGRE
jgi:hypothetical protein